MSLPNAQTVKSVSEDDVMIFSGKVVAQDVPYEEWLTGDFGRHTEWVYGVVIEMAAVTVKHGRLGNFLHTLFDVYLELTTGGAVFQDPLVMKTAPDLPGRQPDVQVLLLERLHQIKKHEIVGPANLVVEIVSAGSLKRDRGEKFSEYEQGGVDEYWILDPDREESLFYVRAEDGKFHSRLPIDGVYTSHVLSKLKLKVSLFWEEDLPTTRETVKLVEAMLKESE